MRRVLAIFFCIMVVAISAVNAQEAKEEKPDFAEPKKDWKWDEDKRFDFLMERLASLEASLDAVERAIAKASGKKGARQGEARRADAGNSAMDRKGGGPMKWNEFYGTTAEKFFYHPVDPNTTYHTSTVLSQVGSQQEDKAGASVQGNSGVPVHQRPPQFDYIYRANRNAKERAEADAAAIQGKLDALNERREKLEAEQAELWGRLAFRAIQRLNIPRRPELRFRLVAASTDPGDESRAVVLEAAARFLATSLLIIDKAEKEQATALGNIRHIITDARNEFDDVLVSEASVTADSSDKDKPLEQFTALAQLLDDTSNNLSESYEVALDGGQFNDTARKDQFRGLLQRSLIEYAQVVMALDESVRVLQKEWGVKVDTMSRLPELVVSWDRDGIGAGSTLGERPERAKKPRLASKNKLPGVVLHFAYSDVSNSEIKDSSGSNNDGLSRGAVVDSDPERGRVLKCDDVGFVSVPDAKSLNPNVVTVMAWVRSAGDQRLHTDWRCIVDKSDWAENNIARGYCLRVGDLSGRGRDLLNFSIGNQQWSNLESTSSLPRDAWVHLAGTYDGSSLRVFINGEPDASAHTSSTAILPSKYALQVGASTYDNRAVRKCVGLIDEVMVFDRALSPEEIRSVYEATRAGESDSRRSDRENPLVGRWRWFAGGKELAPVEFFPEGRVVGEGTTGKWVLLDASKKEYEITWSNGFVDLLTMAADGLVLTGRNTNGGLIEAKRK
jgi:hypothetical protein